MSRIFILFTMMVLPLLVLGQVQHHPYSLYIHNFSTAKKDISPYQYYLIELSPSHKRSAMESTGMEIIRRLDSLYYIVSFNKEREGEWARINNKGLWEVNNIWKFSQTLESLPSDQIYNFIIRVRDESSFISYGSSHKTGKNSFSIFSTIDKICQMAEDPNVIYIGLRASNPFEEAAVLDYNFTVNGINRLWQKYPYLKGQGMAVSIKENHYNSEDLDIKSRHFDSDLGNDEQSGHATDMAVLVAGGGNTGTRATGVAPEAAITSSDFNILFPDPIETFDEHNISVQNHSYGVAVNNEYTVEAEAYDQLIYNNPSILHVFSSGNHGVGEVLEGPYAGIAGYGNLTGGFKMAKNIITVGSVDTLLAPQLLVSNGPAHDGRLKPELVAYSQTGSSGAAALVSGTAVLLQQFYLQNFNQLPSSALLKAVLINSAEDVGAPSIDYKTGYGNLDAYNALQTLEAERFVSGQTNYDDVYQYNIEVPANTSQLKITLVWNDAPALPGDAVVLVNDLDLKVSSAEEEFLPWVLNSYPHVDSLKKPAIREEDHLNNVEQITINNPQEGQYTINVFGYDVPQGPQEFFIAYDFEMNNQFEWTYPVGGDNIPFDGERVQHLRWNSTLDETGSVFYSLNGSEEWKLVEEEVSLSDRFQYWAFPDTFALARVKMVVGDQEYISEEFIISRPLRVQVGFNCEDSVMFQWPKYNNALKYNLYHINDDELEYFASSMDTSAVVLKNSLSTPYFAVEPQFASGEKGIRSLTYNYNFQGVDCYVSSFLVNTTENNDVDLSLFLGTTHQINEVIFEKIIDGFYKEIAVIKPDKRTVYSYTDQQPHDGNNTYRARLVFEGNDEIITEEYTLFLLREREFVIYPNPVHTDDEYLVLQLKDFVPQESIFTLYDYRGKLVYQEVLTSERSFLDLLSLTEGVYIFHLLTPEVSSRGKLVLYR